MHVQTGAAMHVQDSTVDTMHIQIQLIQCMSILTRYNAMQVQTLSVLQCICPNSITDGNENKQNLKTRTAEQQLNANANKNPIDLIMTASMIPKQQEQELELKSCTSLRQMQHT